MTTTVDQVTKTLIKLTLVNKEKDQNGAYSSFYIPVSPGVLHKGQINNKNNGRMYFMKYKLNNAKGILRMLK